MNTQADKTAENKSQAVANSLPKLQSNGESAFQFVDNRPEAIAQRKLQEAINNSPRVQQLKAYQEMVNNSPQVKQLRAYQAMAKRFTSQTAQRKENLEEEILQGKVEPIQKKENDTGLPDNLKSGIENLSGYSMNDVKVHYNSDKPAQLQAHAYAHGTDIHIASGQEKHLPHEVWHVVQQKQGRVKPTMQTKGVSINDDANLEKEADVQSEKALQLQAIEEQTPKIQRNFQSIVQLVGDSDSASDKSGPSLETAIKKLETILGQATNEKNEGNPDLVELKKKLQALRKVESGTDEAAKRAEAMALRDEFGSLGAKKPSDSESKEPVQKKQDGTIQRLTRAEIAAIAVGGAIVAVGIGWLIRRLFAGNDAVVPAVAPEITGMRIFVNGLPVLNNAGDMAALIGPNAPAIITAQGNMAQDNAIAEHTIAMFHYMDTHAAALAGRIALDFGTLADDQKDGYLQEMSNALSAKIQRGLWIGGDDRGMIAVGALDPAVYFSDGRTHLLLKAGQALVAHKTLESLLESHSNNMDAKSYGRRNESMRDLDIGSLPTVGIDITPPLVGVPVPHARPACVYIAEDYITVVPVNTLLVGTDYILRINNGPGIPVTVSHNAGGNVTFSSVG